MKQYRSFRFRNLSFLVNKKALYILASLLLLTVVGVIFSVGVGDMYISPVQVVKALFGSGTEAKILVIRSFRLPRVITALLAGSALAVAGVILQGIIRNPLASPNIIGITGGASAGAVLFLSYFTSSDVNNSLTVSIKWLPVAAFLGAGLIAILVYTLAWKDGVSPVRLVLIGIGLSATMQALTTMLIILSPIYLASQAYVWLTGSVYATTWSDVLTLLPWLVGLLPIAFMYAKDMNVQILGDEIAQGVGSAVEKKRLILLLISVGLAASSVSVAGGISFVGLMAPHIARKLVGPTFEVLLPTSALLGGLILLLADLIARVAFLPLDLPAGIFTAAIGAPYFIYLLYKTNK
ncbi:iron ABC transporter permease [Halanaerocella petrolearia]